MAKPRYEKHNLVVDRKYKLIRCDYCYGFVKYYPYNRNICVYCSVCNSVNKNVDFYDIIDMKVYLTNG
jgi:hypothetical protein